jgi:hypothetical protein
MVVACRAAARSSLLLNGLDMLLERRRWLVVRLFKERNSSFFLLSPKEVLHGAKPPAAIQSSSSSTRIFNVRARGAQENRRHAP